MGAGTLLPGAPAPPGGSCGDLEGRQVPGYRSKVRGSKAKSTFEALLSLGHSLSAET